MYGKGNIRNNHIQALDIKYSWNKIVRKNHTVLGNTVVDKQINHQKEAFAKRGCNKLGIIWEKRRIT